LAPPRTIGGRGLPDRVTACQEQLRLMGEEGYGPLPPLRHSWPFKCSNTARHMTQQQRRNDLPPTPSCEEKRRLIEEFLESNHVLMNLQNQQTQAVIDQDPEFSRFDDLIHLAREKKDQAKYALIAHVDVHHC
jgi:hypothetical protein